MNAWRPEDSAEHAQFYGIARDIPPVRWYTPPPRRPWYARFWRKLQAARAAWHEAE